MILKRLDDLGRGALAGASSAFVLGHLTSALMGWPFPDAAAYWTLGSGAVIGAIAALPMAKPKQAPAVAAYTEPSPRLREAVAAYQDNRLAHERRLCEPEAARLGISVDDMHAAYRRIWKGMENV